MANPDRSYRWDAVIKRVKDLPGEIAGAELGVWRGRMSEMLLKGLPELRLIMVDRWAPPVPGDSYHMSGSQMALCDQNKFDQVFNEAANKVTPYSKRIAIYRMKTSEAAKEVDDRSLDFCFIDADHSYEGVKEDILCWKPKIKAGGWIGGHDWNNFKKGNVNKAVLEFFGEDRLQLDWNSTWFVRL